MANIETRLLAVCALAALAWPLPARAQQAQGFAVERLVLSAPGNTWISMDDLKLQGGLNGAVGLTFGYAHDPLQLESRDGTHPLDVVQHEAFVNLGIAIRYDRFRFHLEMSGPLRVAGQSGVLEGTNFTGPDANLEHNPDSISDVQLGAEARLWGDADGPLRLGVGVTLIAPSGERADYLTDDTYRAMGRLLLAGNSGRFEYGADLGIHLRPLDDSPVPQSPQGSELLFGVAAGAKLPVLSETIFLGPEIFGASAFHSLLGHDTTALEGLLTARFDGSRVGSGRIRIKLGLGAGLHPEFGAPRWRAVLAVEFVSLFHNEMPPGVR